ncbi:C40 family peptidase [Dactylosporangium sp. AC04546]|uniref:C40 family peptidase n=1 Tax=Dactylosporangium sp. AC04546 TaxID=2862460 RepID=UPI001EDE51FD|nr:C40 family peptidase [Dactylosporangium sp. AC04546]WVK89046.1 C40 family peptidase [Dactylosporangium sp. AC04546]
MRRWLLVLAALLWCGPCSLLLMAGVSGALGAGSGGAAGGAYAQACGPGGPGAAVEGVRLDAEQLGNAQTIVSTAQAFRPDGTRAAVIAVATALQESSLRNSLEQLDHDSVGLFQQRVSIYGGEVAADPVKATTAFLTRLVRVPGWATIPLTQAAQAVQRSAYPEAYAPWESLATALVERYWTTASPAAGPLLPTADPVIDPLIDPLGTPGTGAPGYLQGCGGGTDGAEAAGGGLPAGFEPPADPTLATVVGFALAQLGKPYEYGAEGPDTYDCSGLVQTAWATVGVALPRVTTDQAHAGTEVPGLDAMVPGDLILIPGKDGTVAMPGHVGMYIGRGPDGAQYVVQAPKTGDVVKVTPVSNWQTIATIRRPYVSE